MPVTIDARTGRPSSEGVRVLRKRLKPDHEVVLFDLGTNDDPSQTAALGRNLATVRDLVADRCLVVSTLERPPLNGVRVDGMNRVVRNFASATPSTQLLEWQAAVGEDPGLLGKDGVHATPAGYAERARLAAATIEECSASNAPERPERGSAAPPPDEPRSGPRTVESGRSWVELLTGLALYETIAGYVSGTFDIALATSRDMSGAVSPRPPEIRLGDEPGARRRPAPARRTRRR